LLAWDTADDTVFPGAWFHGRIYESGCSVSPDGALFGYLATKYDGHSNRDVNYAWTAISKLPWLTALALWPHSELRGGSVQFVDNETLIIDCPHWERLITKDKLPDGFAVHPRWVGSGAPEQQLPKTNKPQGSLDGSFGIDQSGRAFQYIDGKLTRDGQLIVDLGSMSPDPQPPPDFARTW